MNPLIRHYWRARNAKSFKLLFAFYRPHQHVALCKSQEQEEEKKKKYFSSQTQLRSIKIAQDKPNRIINQSALRFGPTQRALVCVVVSFFFSPLQRPRFFFPLHNTDDSIKSSDQCQHRPRKWLTRKSTARCESEREREANEPTRRTPASSPFQSSLCRYLCLTLKL